MSREFGKWVRARMLELNKTNKDIESGILDQVEGGNWDTVKTKFSKLINGDRTGASYFFDASRPERLRSLGVALGTDAEALRQEYERCRELRTLVLDPRLPAEAAEFLRGQAADPAAKYRCVEVDPGEDLLRAMKDAAAQEDGPILVIHVPDDLEALRLTDLPLSLVEKVPRGFRLKSFPELVPIPPAAPPRTRTEDGAPLVPLEDPWRPERANPWERPPERTARHIYETIVRPCDEREETPCLTAEQAVIWSTRDQRAYHGDAPLIHWVAAPDLSLAQVLGTEPKKTVSTQVWLEANEVYAAGPRVGEVAKIFAPHHEVRVPAYVEQWEELTRGANPWQLPSDAKQEGSTLRPIARALEEWAETERPRLAKLVESEPVAPGLLATGDLGHRTREWLRELSRREVAPLLSKLAFILDRAAEASLVIFGESAESSMRCAADLGGGNIVFLSSLRVRGIPRPWKELSGLYDGGDVLLALSLRVNHRELEGAPISARARRAESRYYDDDED